MASIRLSTKKLVAVFVIRPYLTLGREKKDSFMPRERRTRLRKRNLVNHLKTAERLVKKMEHQNLPFFLYEESTIANENYADASNRA